VYRRCVRSRRSSDFRQPQEVDRLHTDQQHSGNLSVPALHHRRRSTAARHHHDPLHRPRHRHGSRYLAGVRTGRKRHYEAYASRPGQRQTCQSQVGNCVNALFILCKLILSRLGLTIVCMPILCLYKVGTCESFFFRSNRISNRIGRPIRFQIESSNRIGRIYHASRNTA